MKYIYKQDKEPTQATGQVIFLSIFEDKKGYNL